MVRPQSNKSQSKKITANDIVRKIKVQWERKKDNVKRSFKRIWKVRMPRKVQTTSTEWSNQIQRVLKAEKSWIEPGQSNTTIIFSRHLIGNIIASIWKSMWFIYLFIYFQFVYRWQVLFHRTIRLAFHKQQGSSQTSGTINNTVEFCYRWHQIFETFCKPFCKPKNTYRITQEKRPKLLVTLQKNITSGFNWRKIVAVKQKYWAKSKNGD